MLQEKAGIPGIVVKHLAQEQQSCRHQQQRQAPDQQPLGPVGAGVGRALDDLGRSVTVGRQIQFLAFARLFLGVDDMSPAPGAGCPGGCVLVEVVMMASLANP